MAKSIEKQLKKLQRLSFGGAALTKSTDVLKNARNPSALTGDISGLTQVGIAGGFGSAVMEMALKPLKKRKKKRR